MALSEHSMVWSEAERHLFSLSPLFRNLPPDVLNSLLGRCRRRSLGRGETLFLQNDPAEHVFLVIHGWIKISRLASDGTETVIHMMRCGETFAEPAALTLGYFPATAQAATDSSVLVIPATALVREVERTPRLAMKIIAALSNRIHSVITETEKRFSLPTTPRVAAFLLEISTPIENPAQTLSFELPYDKSLIAARLGMTPESFSRALAKLKPHGVSTQGGLVTIDTPSRLQTFLAPYLG